MPREPIRSLLQRRFGRSSSGRGVGAESVCDDDEVMLITNSGMLIRTRVDEVSIVSRNTQGVRLIGLQGDQKLASIGKVVEANEQSDAEAGGQPDAGIDDLPDDEA